MLIRALLTIDPIDVERRITGRTRAIIAVHLAGQPCDMSALRLIADRHKVALIEDCCASLLGRAQWQAGRNVGRHGMLQPAAKQAHYVRRRRPDDDIQRDYARRAMLFSDKAWPREAVGLGSWRFLFLSQNYRMSELQGAVALGQLSKIEDIVCRRRDRAQQLSAALAIFRVFSLPTCSQVRIRPGGCTCCTSTRTSLALPQGIRSGAPGGRRSGLGRIHCRSAHISPRCSLSTKPMALRVIRSQRAGPKPTRKDFALTPNSRYLMSLRCSGTRITPNLMWPRSPAQSRK